MLVVVAMLRMLVHTAALQQSHMLLAGCEAILEEQEGGEGLKAAAATAVAEFTQGASARSSSSSSSRL